MNYGQSVKYLESFWKFGIRLGLHRIKHLLGKLGDPQEAFLSVHVAGTNGKGSVCAMLSSILTEAGYRTGMYTSPHLRDYTERIRINCDEISKKDFALAIGSIREIISARTYGREKPTEFEILTAAAFKYFKKREVDIAVVEVGLGGRLDSTNVIKPMVSVITNISLDHVNILGRTVSSIAREKAGIIKKGVPVVTGAEGEALKVIKESCRKTRLVILYTRT
jgi:dihydrofolate synthase / folylpolyglutamate synthase